jgi:hypothetical protein
MARLLAASEAQGAGKLAKILYSFLILPSVFLGKKILREMQRNWRNLQKGICVLILLTEEGNKYVICISGEITINTVF